MIASDDAYRQVLREVVLDLKERWGAGAPKGDAYKLGFNAALFNALNLIEDIAHNHGVPRESIGLHEPPDCTGSDDWP